MKKLDFIILLFFYVNIYSQKTMDFFNLEIIRKGEQIIRIKAYDSKSGIYSYSNCDGYSKTEDLYFVLTLTETEKEYLYKIRKKNKLLNSSECIITEDLDYTDSFYFNSKNNSIPKCIKTEKQKENFNAFRGEVNNIIKSKKEYRKVFYWEFIQK